MASRLSERVRRLELRRQDRILTRIERDFTGQLSGEIARAMREMVQTWQATGIVPPASEHRDRLLEVIEALSVSAAAAFGVRVLEQGKAIGLDLETKDFAATVQRIARAYIAQEVVRRRITAIAETTRADIVAGVLAGNAAGLGQAGIAQAIIDRVGSVSVSRAALIARTESHAAANAGSQAAAQETGVPMRRQWIAAEDSRTRQSHADADGQIVGMGEPFRVGAALLQFPGDPSGPAAEVINCRCAVGYVVEGY